MEQFWRPMHMGHVQFLYPCLGNNTSSWGSYVNLILYFISILWEELDGCSLKKKHLRSGISFIQAPNMCPILNKVRADLDLPVSCYILTFAPAKHAIPKRCTGRKWRIPMASNRKKSRRWIWLTKWDKVKAHDTLIDWCTRREWPLNCMTVISSWWQSNIPFQRLSGRLSGQSNYYITRWRQEVSELGVREVGDKLW